MSRFSLAAMRRTSRLTSVLLREVHVPMRWAKFERLHESAQDKDGCQPETMSRVTVAL